MLPFKNLKFPLMALFLVLTLMLFGVSPGVTGDDGTSAEEMEQDEAVVEAEAAVDVDAGETDTEDAPATGDGDEAAADDATAQEDVAPGAEDGQ